ncbi:hypothetical protein AAVH_12351 [Aphelenchoides avenae]|nr:hypothetical protein AAVH_12351 [Aphelenchus avenae]
MDYIVWSLILLYVALELVKRCMTPTDTLDGACLLVCVVFWVIPGSVLPRVLAKLVSFAVKLLAGCITYAVTIAALDALTTPKFYEDLVEYVIWALSSPDAHQKYQELLLNGLQLSRFPSPYAKSATAPTAFTDEADALDEDDIQVVPQPESDDTHEDGTIVRSTEGYDELKEDYDEAECALPSDVGVDSDVDSSTALESDAKE